MLKQILRAIAVLFVLFFLSVNAFSQKNERKGKPESKTESKTKSKKETAAVSDSVKTENTASKRSSGLTEEEERILQTETRPVIDVGDGKESRIPILGDILGTLDKAKEVKEAFAEDSSEGKTKKRKRERYKKTQVFHGLEARKVFKRAEQGRNIITEMFYYLPDYKKPSSVVDKKYYMNAETEAIESSRQVKRVDNLKVLHGPYVRKRNGILVEKGYYYRGVKHGRWEKYHKTKGSLESKVYYDKGFPKNSIRMFHDEKKTKLKAIISVVDGYKNGYAVYYYPGGSLKAKGYHLENERVGTWVEYYENGKRKQELKYNNVPYDKDKPETVRSWSEDGSPIK